MRRGFLLALWMLPLFGFAQTAWQNKVRESYFGLDGTDCNSLKLAEYFEEHPPKDAVMTAYYGASSAAAPQCLFSPASKISYFRRGKQLLAKAVNQQPDNFEIRFLRFATQTMTPGFLGYNENIEEDKAFLLKNLAKGRQLQDNKKIFDIMLKFMLDSDYLTPAEKRSISMLKI